VSHGALVRLEPGAIFPPRDQRFRQFDVPSRRRGIGGCGIGPPVELAELRVGQRFIVPAGAGEMDEKTFGGLQGIVGLDKGAKSLGVQPRARAKVRNSL
jgi:hypothetical protein